MIGRADGSVAGAPRRAKPAPFDAIWAARALMLGAIEPWRAAGLATLRKRSDGSLELRLASGGTWILGENGIMREA